MPPSDPGIGTWGSRRMLSIVALAVLIASTISCATQGDFLRLQEKVAGHHMANRDAPDPFARIAKLSADVDAMRQEIRDLQGELELARKEAADALVEVRLARTSSAQSSTEAGSAAAGTGAVSAASTPGFEDRDSGRA